MAELTRQFPDDDEAALFYALGAARHDSGRVNAIR
jgi:hypothetical protein